MTDKPEVISYWYAVDSNADKPYIKKEKGSGLLASFDCAEDAQRFCQWRQDVKYKEVQYVRLTDHEAARAADKARIAELEAEKARCFIPEGVWHEGCPRHPYGSEWFIAKLDNGQRVVLKELPEEHSYDYRTADETYYSAYRIAAWMQFPDSQYVAALAQQGKEGGV